MKSSNGARAQRVMFMAGHLKLDLGRARHSTEKKNGRRRHLAVGQSDSDSRNAYDLALVETISGHASSDYFRSCRKSMETVPRQQKQRRGKYVENIA